MHIKATLLGKRGNQLIEASIAMPIIILTVLLLLRLFVFYMEVLDMGVDAHDEALAETSKYEGITIVKNDATKSAKLLRGGILNIDVVKSLPVRSYFINEDNIVRSKGLVEDED